MTATNDLSWYALRVISQREDMVKKALINRGHKAFIKTERRFGKWIKGKRDDKEYVAAPSYVFLGINGNPWMEVHRNHLIRSVVSLCGRPVLLDPVALADFLGFDDFDMPEYMRYFHEAPFAIGDLVKIDSRSFEGFELRVKDIQRGEAIFSLVMMGRETEARFPVSQCYKAEAA
jgi:transcription antitermination factor NusG